MLSLGIIVMHLGTYCLLVVPVIQDSAFHLSAAPPLCLEVIFISTPTEELPDNEDAHKFCTECRREKNTTRHYHRE
ncbi:hypothetical protein EDD18DRAFT_1178484 [Armillaria luteobubalina]|uniref:Secreted protein n=1 Tax=Armillaria luteobubalina TaxID=153913 RepID=A0AA39Q0S9_9AGAR|nr:hypothetical protein EDD18DRAFT_1178484 [Armillaria luteobubalina]